MQQATQITLRNIRRSTMVARRIREKCDQLERFHPHILVNDARHLQLHMALREAFAAAGRQLKDAASVRRAEVKAHPHPLKEAA